MFWLKLAGFCLAAYWGGWLLTGLIKWSVVTAFKISRWLWDRRPRFVTLVPRWNGHQFRECRPITDGYGAGDHYAVHLGDHVYCVTHCDWVEDIATVYLGPERIEGYRFRVYMDKIVKAHRRGKFLHGI